MTQLLLAFLLSTTQPCFAHVAGLYPVESNFLTDGVAQGKALSPNMKAVKLWLSSAFSSADYPNQTFGGAYTTLAGLASDPAFDTVFSDAQITTYLLGTFSFTDGLNNPWINGTAPSYLTNVENDVYNLGDHLLSTYSGKTFIIQNWEGDWALLGTTTPTDWIPKDRAQSMVAWFRARQRGVERARQHNPTSTSTLLFAVEVNRTLDPYRRVVRDVLPFVPVDAVSISAYECINPGFSAGSMTAAKASIDSLLRQEVAAIRQAKPNVPIYIGEFGWPEEEKAVWWSTGQAIDQVFTTSNSLGLFMACYWDVFDNSSPYRGYSLYDQSLVITPAGTAMAAH